MGSCDIALTEVIQGKLSYELVAAPLPGAPEPRIVEAPVFTPKNITSVAVAA
jgi:hypothetical protein